MLRISEITTGRFSGRLLAFSLPVAALAAALLLAACGGEQPANTAPPPTEAGSAMVAPTSAPEPTASPVPADTPAPTMPAPAASEEPTEAPLAASTPEATEEPTAMPVPSTVSQATATPATPEPTATPAPPATPAPTAVPATPEPTAAPAMPQPTTAPPAPVQPCEGDRGGEIGNCAPEFQGTQEWVNSEPLSMESLRGKVVLIDFWTYSCINCIRTIPFLQSWHERYADEGLVIVGVHTPEFEFEKVYDNVVDATVDMGVGWPVVQDNEYQVWSDYSNRFWPAKYLIDKNGVVQFRHFGEGRYAETEEEIRRLLAEVGSESDAMAMPLPENRQERDATYLAEGQGQTTPELFAGWKFTVQQRRGGIGQVDTYLEAARASFQSGTLEGVVGQFELPAQYAPHLIYFLGPWSIGPESAVHARETEIYTDVIVLRYSAKSVNVVLTSDSGEPYKVLVTVNDAFLTEENKGEDITIDDNGESYLIVASPKAYRIIEHPKWEGDQILAMSSLSDDFGLFSFTFGAYEDGF